MIRIKERYKMNKLFYIIKDKEIFYIFYGTESEITGGNMIRNKKNWVISLKFDIISN